MAAQRIVLTSPWKLGLFVFMLVAGTGFGLIYAYMELFGGEIDLRNEENLRLAYMVLGGVAAIGLLGYIAVVSSARPLDRVVRNSRQREQLMKKFGKIQDPRMIDIEEYEDEPALKVILERWAEQATEASDARLSAASQKEALAQLTSQLRESAATDFQPQLPDSTPDLDALVDAIKGFATTAPAQMSAASAPVQTSGSHGWVGERSTWHQAAEQLFRHEQELEGFVRSVAEHATEIAARTENLGHASGALPREAAMAVEGLRRNGQRMGKVREASRLLSEEANKLALAMGVQLSREDNASPELMNVSEGLRTLSNQYQRIASEAETARTEQDAALEKIESMGASTMDSSTANALHQQAMALDQHAEALNELLTRFRTPMQQIRALAPEVAAAMPPLSKPVAPFRARQESPSENTRDFEMKRGPVAEPTPVEEVNVDSGRIYEIAELGGRELEANSAGRVYDLDEFGAVEL